MKVFAIFGLFLEHKFVSLIVNDLTTCTKKGKTSLLPKLI